MHRSDWTQKYWIHGLKGITRFHLPLELESEAKLRKPSLSKFCLAGQWFSVALMFLMKSKPAYTYVNVTVLYIGLTTSVEGGVPSFGLCPGIRFMTTRVASIGKSFEIDQLTTHCCGSFPYGHDDQRFHLSLGSLVGNARALP